MSLLQDKEDRRLLSSYFTECPLVFHREGDAKADISAAS